jgi:hypothetical protein
MPGSEKIVSVTTAPERSRPTMMPTTVTIGIMALASACLKTTIVLAQHLKHSRAGDASQKAGEKEGERNRRQRHRAKPAERVIEEKHVAAAWQPAEILGEENDEHQRKIEIRERDADHREYHRSLINPGILPERSDDAAGEPDSERDYHRIERKAEGYRQPD